MNQLNVTVIVTWKNFKIKLKGSQKIMYTSTKVRYNVKAHIF